MHKKVCLTCKHFHQRPRFDEGDPITSRKLGNGGECRQRPPMIPLTEGVGYTDREVGAWPLVFASWWCGRHQPRRTPADHGHGLTIRWNSRAAKRTCVLCGGTLYTRIGPEFFIRGTMDVVCLACMKDCNPDMATLRDEMHYDPAWPHNARPQPEPARNAAGSP